MLACLYVGLFIGLAYDLTRPICLNGKRLTTAVADAAFWALACWLCLSALYRINGLDLRLFNLIFFGVGFVLYKTSFSHLLRFIFTKIYAVLHIACSKFFELLK